MQYMLLVNVGLKFLWSTFSKLDATSLHVFSQCMFDEFSTPFQQPLTIISVLKEAHFNARKRTGGHFLNFMDV